MLEEKTNDLKRDLVGFATLVEHMIEKSIRGLLEKKRELLVEVIEEDEPKANELETKNAQMSRISFFMVLLLSGDLTQDPG